jgi:hypothetical protein
VPAAALGIPFKHFFERLHDSQPLIATMLAGVGLLLFAVDRRAKGEGKQPGPGGALLIGVAQSTALIPGVSRSGASIIGGRLVGLSRAAAVRFSFLLSIPTILGAVVIEGRHIAHVETSLVLTGLVCAAVSGYAAIGFLLKHVPRTGLWPYAIYRILLAGKLKQHYQVDPKDSWLLAAAEKGLPIIVPGWEDSTLGNIYAAHCIESDVKSVHTVKMGIECMMELARWYTEESPRARSGIGFFQIGGGIAGDFPICVVPMLHQDLQRTSVPLWGYFCQISDSTTSYGSYSGAVPNEKITWGKLAAETPKYIVESDASIVAPLVFAYVLGW